METKHESQVTMPAGVADSAPALLWQWLVEGPDPTEANEPVTPLQLLLPWPVRWAIVGGAIMAAGWWRGTGLGQQIAWGLHVGALAAVAIIASLWGQILLVDSALASLWLIPFRPPRGRRIWWRTQHLITFLNRQAGHVALLVTWILVALASSVRLELQIGTMFAVVLLGLPLLNGLARQPLGFLGPDDTQKASGDLLWRRRLLIYVATAVGLAVLAFSSYKQILRILPLVGALGAGMVIRLIRHMLRDRKVKHEKGAGATERLTARAAFRKSQNDAARHLDVFGPGVVLLGTAALVAVSYWQRQKLDGDLPSLDGPAAPTDVCGRDPHAPVVPDLALFVVGDAQIHELGGERFPGQTEIAEAFVKSASRPLAQALLASVSLRHFADIYEKSAAAWKKESSERARKVGARNDEKDVSPMLWAHLGDLADLACKDELIRANRSLEAFGKDRLAGIAMGNHEMSFVGSFHWNPYWDSTCYSGRLEKDYATNQLVGALGSASGDGPVEFLRLESSVLRPRGGSLSAVTRLGLARHVREGAPSVLRTRGVVGIFVDTSDGRAFDWGMPGSIGGVSQRQLDAIADAADRVRARGGPYEDPAYVLFQHIPYGELEDDSKERLARLIDRLDDRQGDPEREPRVLAIVSAHTHVAGAHRYCIRGSRAGGRVLREIVIGSTTDAPQQAATIEIGADDRGQLALSLRTIHSVARAGMTCGGTAVTSAGACRQAAARLFAAPACRPLLGVRSDTAPPRDCQDLEEPVSFGAQLAALRTFSGPQETTEKKRLDKLAARQLLSCVCREGACSVDQDPLANEAYERALNEAYAMPQRAEELVCLAWAASTRQAHKAAAPNMGEALRCAFDDPTMPPERVSTASLEIDPCY